MFKRISIVAALMAALLLPGVVSAQTTPPLPASLIVKLIAGLTAEQQAAVIERNGGVEVSSVRALRLHVIQVAVDQLVVTLARYKADPQVVSAEANKLRKSEAIPADVLYAYQWALPKIGWEEVYGTVLPAGTATVAVLDTGIDAAHPDLAGKLVPGISILDGSAGTIDPSGHGTWVAGLVAANTSSTEGIAGVAFSGVKLMPVTVLDADGLGQDSDVIQGVVWAAENGADVILMAFSAGEFSPALQDAIDYAWSLGVVLVAAVGNDGVNGNTFPAGDRGVMGVAATDQNDAHAPFSNTGQSVFVAAPGVAIQTLAPGGAYNVVTGTSTSAAIVAGVAGFMKAVDPTLSNGVIVGRIARNADPAGNQDQTGNGRVNMARALADTSTEDVQPAGADPVGAGGPFVGPYRAAAGTNKTMTYTKAGSGSGTATFARISGDTPDSATGGCSVTGNTVNCTANGTFKFKNGDPYTINASANAGSTFAGWSGQSGSLTTANCGGTTNPCSSIALSNDSGITATFNTAGPTKVAFTTAAFTGVVNQCLGPLTVQTQNSSSVATNVTSDTTVNLSTNDSGTFHSDSSCSTAALTSRVITSGNNSTSFFYKATARGSGSHQLTASATGLTSALQAQTIDKANQAPLTAIATPNPVTFGNTATLSTTGGTTAGTVTFDATGSTGCSIAGTTLSVTNASGTCSITATMAGNTNYNLVTSGALLVGLQKANQAALTAIATPNPVTFGNTATLSTTGGTTAGTVTFDATGSTGCSIAGTTLSVTNASGTCSITATMAGNTNYNPVTSGALLVGLQKANQAALTAIATPNPVTFGSTAVLSTTGGTTAGPVTFDVTGSTGCSIAGTTLSVTNASGTCSITATMAGNTNYNAVTSAAATVTLQKATQAITFNGLTDKHFGDPDFTVSATGGASGQPVTFTAAGSCSVTGALVHITGVGTCTITAHQAGDANYSAALDVPQAFNVTDNTPPNTSMLTGPTSPTNATTAVFTFSGTDDVTPPASLTFECQLDGGGFSVCTSPKTYTSLSDGAHTFDVRAKDAAGNVDPSPATFNWSVDTAPPDTTLTSMPFDPSNQTTANFAFTATEPASTFACSLSSVNGGAFAPCSSPAQYTGLTDGSYTFQVRAIDPAGNPDPTPASFTWTVDTQAPDTAIDSAPADPTNSNTATFTFHGDLAGGDTFQCQLDAQAATACNSGTVTYSGLGAGSHTFTVTATDAAHNSDPSPASFTWIIDVTPPDTSITAGPADGSSTTNTSASFDFAGTDNLTAPAALTFECSLDGADFAPCTSPAVYSALSRSDHTFRVRAKDAAGNVDPSPASATWTITKITPVITWSDPADITYPAALGATQLNATADVAGAFVYTPASGITLNAGNNQDLTVNFTPTDTTNYGTAGKTVHINILKGSQSINVTTPAPGTATYNSPFNVAATATSGLSVAITTSGVCSGSGTGSATITMTSGTGTCTVSYNQAGDDNYNAAPQVSSNTTAQKANQTINVPTSAPAGAAYNASFGVAATATSGLSVAITTSGVCSGSGTGSATVTMDSGTGTCTVNYNQAGDTNYSAAPQVSSNTAAQKVNQIITVTTSVPASAVYATSFGVAANATSGLSVAITTADACSGSGSGSATVTMNSGTGTCTVNYNQAGDTNYNAAAQVTETTPATKASQAITFGALGDKHFGDADFTVSATGGASGQPVTFTAAGSCSVTGALVHITGVGTCTITAHQAGDANYSAALDVPQAFNVTDNTPPNTSMLTGPTSPTNATTAVFTFSGTDDVTPPASLTFECQLDGGGFSVCTSPKTYTSLSDGAHTFDVRAKDAAGNVDPSPATFNWSVDTAPPDTTLTSMPFDPSNQTTANFAFTATEPASTFACSLSSVNGGAFAPCSSPAQYTGLTDGSYTFQVRAIDLAGNPDPTPASFAWTVDTQAPDTAIDSAPADPTNSNTATFTFHGDLAGGDTFQCQLDAQAATACNSGTVTYSGLGAGSHTFTVTATDAAHNSDPSPASFTWIIDVTPPDTSITAGPADGSSTTNTSASFDFAGTDNLTAPAALTFECSLDGADFAPCTSPAVYSALSRSDHTFRVRAKDAAGNVDPSPASATWTITKITPVITWSDPADITYPAALGATQLNATADVAGAFVYTPASGITLNAGNNQDLTVNFTPTDATNYSTASKTVKINVLQASQTIAFTSTASSNAVFNGPTYSAAATGGASNNPVTFGTSTPSVCSASGNIISFGGVGTCTVTANQAGNTNYAAAAQQTQSFAVGQASQTIAFTSTAPSNAVYNGPTYSAAATGGASNNPVTFGTSTPSVCSASGNIISFGGVGTCTVTANQAGNTNYAAAAQQTQSFAVGQASQTIAFTSTAPSNAVYNGPTYSAAATGGASNNPVTFGTSTPSVCSASGNIISFGGVGTCTVTANQAGNTNYAAAAQQTQSFAVGQASQTIAFTSTAPSNAVYNGPTYSAAATGGASNNPVTFGTSTPSVCSASGNIISFGGVGTCTVTANQAGNTNYAPAAQQTQSFAVGQASQTIAFGVLAGKTFGDPDFTVSATGGTSGQPVTFTAGGNCTVSGSTVHLTGLGSCTVTAHQAGNGHYYAAADVPQSFAIADPPVTMSSFMSDGDFNPITSADAVFTGKTSLTLTATNPGTYMLNKVFRNPNPTAVTVQAVISIPAHTSPALAQAFCLKGSMPVHIYADMARTVDVTKVGTSISPAEPLASATEQSLYCTAQITVSFTIPANGLRYITVHLDYNAKGTTGYPSNAANTYVRPYTFGETDTVNGGAQILTGATPFVVAGKIVTAFGGFLLDTNGVPKAGLKVKVWNGAALVAQDQSDSDGFYFIPVPPANNYTVKVYDAGDNQKATSPSQKIAQDQFVGLNFTNLNPADPVIFGFVTGGGSSAVGISGATVNLYNVAHKLVATTTTSASGSYRFRFTAPGSYTVAVVAPQGYAAKPPVTVDVKMFDEVQVDFSLSAQ